MSVEEYIREFKQLQIQSGLKEGLEQTMASFLWDPDSSIAKKGDLQPYWTFEDICKLVMKEEKYPKHKRPFTSYYARPNS